MKPHIIIYALAGTGKTFTLVEGVKYMRENSNLFSLTIPPSTQQLEIWKQFGIEPNSSAMCFAAFNVSVKDELIKRIGKNLRCDVTTMHSIGYRAIRHEFGLTGVNVVLNTKKTDTLIAETCKSTIHHINRTRPGYATALRQLIRLSKYSGYTQPTNKELSILAAYYSISLSKYRESLFNATRIILKSSLNQTSVVDFDDMPWMPVVLDLPLKQYDTLLLDEAQDLNYCQQNLALRSGKRIIAVGDKHQAIYGFAGADTKSMDTLSEVLKPTAYDCSLSSDIYRKYSHTGRDCISLPLTISYRCSQAVAKEASAIVPEFEAQPSNVEGSVTYGNLSNPKPGDMVLCRVNAPLIRTAFKLISNGIPSKIVGREMRASILAIVRSIDCQSVADLIRQIRKRKEEEVNYFSKQDPVPHTAILTTRDKYNCLTAICEQATSIFDVETTIETLFSDKKQVDCVRLSSIHRAKGMEATNVYIIRPDLLPHPLAQSDWQVEQEMNLKYVAVTRAKENLIWVEE